MQHPRTFGGKTTYGNHGLGASLLEPSIGHRVAIVLPGILFRRGNPDRPILHRRSGILTTGEGRAQRRGAEQAHYSAMPFVSGSSTVHSRLTNMTVAIMAPMAAAPPVAISGAATIVGTAPPSRPARFSDRPAPL